MSSETRARSGGGDANAQPRNAQRRNGATAQRRNGANALRVAEPLLLLLGRRRVGLAPLVDLHPQLEQPRLLGAHPRHLRLGLGLLGRVGRRLVELVLARAAAAAAARLVVVVVAAVAPRARRRRAVLLGVVVVRALGADDAALGDADAHARAVALVGRELLDELDDVEAVRDLTENDVLACGGGEGERA